MHICVVCMQVVEKNLKLSDYVLFLENKKHQMMIIIICTNYTFNNWHRLYVFGTIWFEI